MSPEALDLCPSCQAPHGPNEAFCWMCRRRFWDDRAAQPKPRAPFPIEEPEQPSPAPKLSAPISSAAAPISSAASGDRWTQPILIAGFILILTGLALGSSTGAIVLWLGILPAFFVTALAGFRTPKTSPKTFGEKLERGLTLFASVVAVMILAAAGLTFAMTAVCAAIVAGLR